MCLFGFAIYHPDHGGLSWMRSSLVVDLDEAIGRAMTYDGRIYELGRRTEPENLADPEALAALRLLGLSEPCETSAEAWELRRWVVACKVARWVGEPPPPNEPNEVDQFLENYGKAYRERRRAGSARLHRH